VGTEEIALRRWISKVISPGQLGQLRAISMWRTLWAAFHIWSAIIAAFYLLEVSSQWGLWTRGLTCILCAVFIATRQNALAVQMHEGAHGLLFRSARLNDLFSNWLYAYWILNRIEAYRVVHFKHHLHLHENEDPDLKIYAYQFETRKSISYALLKDLFLATAIERMCTYWRYRSNDTSAATLPKFVAFVWQLTPVLLLLAIYGDPIKGVSVYFLFWLLPLLTLYPIIVRIRTVAEHFTWTMPDNGKAAFVARTTITGFFERYFIGANMEYHFEHHLFPAIPHYNLRRFRKRLFEISGIDREAKARQCHGYAKHLTSILFNKAK
jgi:fatty acid desaturase